LFLGSPIATKPVEQTAGEKSCSPVTDCIKASQVTRRKRFSQIAPSCTEDKEGAGDDSQMCSVLIQV